MLWSFAKCITGWCLSSSESEISPSKSPLAPIAVRLACSTDQMHRRSCIDGSIQPDDMWEPINQTVGRCKPHELLVQEALI